MAESPPPPMLTSVMMLNVRISQLEQMLAKRTEENRLLAQECDAARQRLHSAIRDRDTNASLLSYASSVVVLPLHKGPKDLVPHLRSLVQRAWQGEAALDVLRASHTSLEANGQHDLAAELIMMSMGAGIVLTAKGDT